MWVCPSRSRPDNCRRLFAAGISTPGFLCVDHDDPLIDEYRRLELPGMWSLDVNTRAPLSEIYNRVFEANPHREWYGLGADDIVPETPDWDHKLVAAAGNDGIAYADDGINGEKHGTHLVIAGSLVREMGWLALPGLSRLYLDTVWNDIGRARGVLRYLPEVVLRHHHFSNGLALFDGVYRKPDKARDREIYQRWKEQRA